MCRKALLALFILLTLTACSARLSYSFADWIIEWMITDYVSLDKPQKQQLEKTIDKHLAWHKQTQVAAYRDWLIEFKEQAELGLSREWLTDWSGQLTVFWQDLALQVIPDSISFLQSLSDEQVAELIANMDKSQQKLIEEYLDPDIQKRSAERAERTKDFSRRLLGRLNRQQRDLIGEWNRQSGDSTALWLDNREQWTRRFEQAMQNRTGQQFGDEITLLFAYQEQLWTELYRQSIEENFEYGISLVLAIEPTVTDKQRKKLNKVLNKWIKVLDGLST